MRFDSETVAVTTSAIVRLCSIPTVRGGLQVGVSGPGVRVFAVSPDQKSESKPKLAASGSVAASMAQPVFESESAVTAVHQPSSSWQGWLPAGSRLAFRVPITPEFDSPKVRLRATVTGSFKVTASVPKFEFLVLLCQSRLASQVEPECQWFDSETELKTARGSCKLP
jgi:hypothetical protein